mmetsp:Transcript_2250/g.5557  ORF Transcript_2250/g.5557 Transcript_2250/m.5557 type:complete len:324 (+) Transcript_2250:1960-2931(+)
MTWKSGVTSTISGRACPASPGLPGAEGDDPPRYPGVATWQPRAVAPGMLSFLRPFFPPSLTPAAPSMTSVVLMSLRRSSSGRTSSMLLMMRSSMISATPLARVLPESSELETLRLLLDPPSLWLTAGPGLPSLSPPSSSASSGFVTVPPNTWLMASSMSSAVTSKSSMSSTRSFISPMPLPPSPPSWSMSAFIIKLSSMASSTQPTIFIASSGATCFMTALYAASVAAFMTCSSTASALEVPAASCPSTIPMRMFMVSPKSCCRCCPDKLLSAPVSPLERLSELDDNDLDCLEATDGFLLSALRRTMRSTSVDVIRSARTLSR